MSDMSDFWVFGYGSLMWRPGFEHVETRKARLFGYHRALCITSHIHRGTVEKPGLVLGLDRGGSCLGLAFRVSGTRRDEVMAYLRGRELITNVYHEKLLPLRLDSGEPVQAIAYVVDRRHEQYAGTLDLNSAAERVSSARGMSGPNIDYVLNTLSHLQTLGIRDQWLESVAARLNPEAQTSQRPTP
jgi:cation transport protein ChaC